MTVDVDTVGGDNLGRLASSLRELEVPHLLSFSGNKGYHADVFVKESVAGEVTKAGRLLKKLLSREGVEFDEVFPTGTGLTGKTPGGANVKLPLGQHRKTGQFCHCLDEDLVPVSDPVPVLCALEPMDVGQLSTILADSLHLDLGTGELKEPWHSRYPHQLHYSRPCVNLLWQEGLQAPMTRHSATMVIAIAVASNKAILEENKEGALLDWVVRMYPQGTGKRYIARSTTLQYATTEALRLYEAEASRAYIGVTCINRLLRGAMKSACRDPVSCHLARNGGSVDFILLMRLGIFNPASSAEPGIGRGGGFVYQAHVRIARDHAGRHFQYDGRDTYAAPLAMLGELSRCSENTVKKANRDLRGVGLVVKVPPNDVPRHVRKKAAPGQKYVLQASFYCLPDLTDDYIRDVVLPRARSYAG